VPKALRLEKREFDEILPSKFYSSQIIKQKICLFATRHFKAKRRAWAVKKINTMP
jgi:hypothetical protein